MEAYLGPQFFNKIQSREFPSGSYEGRPLIQPGTQVQGGILKINKDNYGLIIDWEHDERFPEEAQLETFYDELMQNYEGRNHEVDEISFLEALNDKISAKISLSHEFGRQLNNHDQDDFPIQKALLKEKGACKEVSSIATAIMEKAVNEGYLNGIPTINYLAVIEDPETAEKYLEDKEITELFRENDNNESWRNEAISPFSSDIVGHQWAELVTDESRIVLDPAYDNIGSPDELEDFGGYLPEFEWDRQS